MTEEAATTGSPGQSETDTQAQGVQDELSALISEGSTETKTDLVKDVKEVVSFVQSQQAEKLNESFRADMDAAVKNLQGVIPEEASKYYTPELIEGYLHKLASDDAAVRTAFLNRNSKPEAWAAAQKSITENFSKQFEAKPDPAITEDREAVIAAAKTQTKPAETTDAEVMKMSRAEFAKEQEKLGVKPYGM